MTKNWFITGTSRGLGREWETPLETARHDYASRLETWEKWNDVSVLAQG